MKRSLWYILITMALLFTSASIVSAATVTQSIPYQGMLTDSSGNPLTGTYSVTFRLYDVAIGGTALSTDTHSVTTTQGLFTTTLTFDPQYFDGRALWLGVKVGSDAEMTPRQPLQPVPYALSLRPGANISGDASRNPSLKVMNTGNNVGNLIAGTTGENSPAVLAMALGPRSLAVYAVSQDGTGVYGQGKEGGYFTTNLAGTYGNYLAGVNVSTVFNYNPGVLINTSGDFSDGVYAVTNGDFSEGVHAETQGYANCGVYAETFGDSSSGVYALTHDDYSEGVLVVTKGDQSDGVDAHTWGDFSDCVHAATEGENSDGVVAYTLGNYSRGVYAYSAKSEGVIGEAENAAGVKGLSTNDIGVVGTGRIGAYFTTNQAKTIYNPASGINVTTTHDYNTGIVITSNGYQNTGIEVEAVGPNGKGISAVGSDIGVYGATFTGTGVMGLVTSGTGVYGQSNTGLGVWGYSGEDAGVKGESYDKAGVWGESNSDVGLYAVTNRVDDKYGVYTPDYIYAKGAQYPLSDVAEYMPVDGDAEPGTVLVIGEDGRLRTTTTEYDTGIAGIVSTAPGVTLGTKDDGNPGEEVIAVAGRVPCRVDTSNGPIHPRDLLTTSGNPGYAMKATDPKIGTILGKAMGTLESGTGTIEVLVTLQ